MVVGGLSGQIALHVAYDHMTVRGWIAAPGVIGLIGFRPGKSRPAAAPLATIRATVPAVAARASHSDPAALCPARPAASCAHWFPDLIRDVGHLQARDLGYPEARAVGDAGRGLVLEAGRGFEQPRHLFLAQNEPCAACARS